jgi:hypothetical protein
MSENKKLLTWANIARFLILTQKVKRKDERWAHNNKGRPPAPFT